MGVTMYLLAYSVVLIGLGRKNLGWIGLQNLDPNSTWRRDQNLTKGRISPRTVKFDLMKQFKENFVKICPDGCSTCPETLVLEYLKLLFGKPRCQENAVI